MTALRELSERDREILTRFYLWDQTPEQICAEMCLSPDQLRILKSRAKQRIIDRSKPGISRSRLKLAALAAVSAPGR